MLYQTAVYIHLLAAITWVGGTLFLVMVMVPLVRSGFETPAQGATTLRLAARRFAIIAWASIAALAATGIYLAWDHWRVDPAEFFTGDRWVVQVLQIKTGLAAGVMLLSALHDFVLGPRLVRRMEAIQGAPPPDIRRARLRMVWIARLNLLLVLAILALAVMLIRGSPL